MVPKCCPLCTPVSDLLTTQRWQRDVPIPFLQVYHSTRLKNKPRKLHSVCRATPPLLSPAAPSREPLSSEVAAHPVSLSHLGTSAYKGAPLGAGSCYELTHFLPHPAKSQMQNPHGESTCHFLCRNCPVTSARSLLKDSLGKFPGECW